MASPPKTSVIMEPGDVAYEDDFHAWCVTQATRLRERSRAGARDGLDLFNLAEEVEGLARSDRRTVKAHLRVLLADLLKWQFQPERRGPSCDNTIFNARTEVADLLRESPSLVSYARGVVADVYPLAARDAAAETGLPRATFPEACPYSPADTLDLAVHPGDAAG